MGGADEDDGCPFGDGRCHRAFALCPTIAPVGQGNKVREGHA